MNVFNGQQEVFREVPKEKRAIVEGHAVASDRGLWNG